MWLQRTRSWQPLQTGFERVIADGSYQRLVEEAIMTPWLPMDQTAVAISSEDPGASES